MYVEEAFRLVTGSLVLTSIFLVYYVSPNWLILGAIAGVCLFQSAFTNFCPMMSIMKWAGMKSCMAELNSYKKNQNKN